MKFREISAVIESADLALAEELICDMFFSFNLKGVVCDLPLDEPDEGFGTQTLPPPEENAIVGFLPDIDSSDLVEAGIRKRAKALADAGVQVSIRAEMVDEADWADAWKQYFHVIRITDRIVIKPEWQPFDPGPGDVVIHLDPGMAFGTGTHPTTAMCLARIERHLPASGSFLDVGCGSGILTIAAAKLGTGRLVGIDTDETAIDISRQNLDKNGIPPDRYTLLAGTLDQTAPEAYDLIAANIIAQVLSDIMGDIRQRLAPGGLAILSGIIQERKPDVLDALDRHNLVVRHEDVTDEWVALTVARFKVQ